MWATPGTASLTAAQRRIARWYLVNGVICHIVMDGLVGVWKLNPLFAAQYARIDKRFAMPVGEYDAGAVHTAMGIELYVKGPLAIYLYYCYHAGRPERDVVEVVTGVTQAYGTLVWLLPDVLSRGAKGNFAVDWRLTFSFHHLVYFWFSVVAAGAVLYVAVPLYLAWGAGSRLRDAVAAASGAASPASKPAASGGSLLRADTPQRKRAAARS